jgi:hypothetical protein
MLEKLCTQKKYVVNYNIYDFNITNDILLNITKNTNHKGNLFISEDNKDKILNQLNNLEPLLKKGDIYTLKYFELKKDFSKTKYVELIDDKGNLIKLSNIENDLLTLVE